MIENKIKEISRTSIVCVKHVDSAVIIFREEIIKDWTPIFEVFDVVEVQRSFVFDYDD